MISDPQASPPDKHELRTIGPPANQFVPHDTRPRAGDARRSLPALIDALIASPSLTHLVEAIPARVAHFLGFRRVLLYEIRDRKLHMTSSTAAVTARGWTATLLRIASVNPIPVEERAPEALALAGRRALIVPGGGGAPTRIIAPLHGLGGPVGVLVVIPADDEGGDGAFPGPALLALEDAARATGLVLESAHLIAENRLRADEMNLLTHLTTAFNNNVLDLDAAVNIVDRQVKGITRVDLCAVVIGTTVSRDGQWLHPDIIKEVGARIILNDVGMWPLAQALPEGVRSFYAFPLFADVRIVGVLALAFRKPRILSEGERDLLSILANTASTVLQRTRLQTEAESARQLSREMLERAQNEERFKDAIVRTIQDGLLTIDREGRVTSLNPQGAALLGLDDDAALGCPIDEVMPLVEAAPHPVRHGLGQRMLTQGREVRVRATNGHELTLGLTIAPLREADGTDLGVLCAFQDRTPLRALEGEIRRLDVAATIGNGARMISHDMYNMINTFLMAIDRMEPLVSTNTEARLDMTYLHKEINRMKALAENILYLSGPKPLSRKVVNLGDLLEGIVRVLMPRAMLAQVSFERQFEPGVLLFADEHQIARAVENLCINAIEAMKGGGKLTLRTRTTRPSGALDPAKAPALRDGQWPGPVEPRVQLPTYSAARNETELLLDRGQKAVEIDIIDTGPGIPAERLPLIWDAGQTFDKGSQGHGLGLAIVKQIVEAHGGTCTVASEVGRGTAFTLRLPSGK